MGLQQDIHKHLTGRAYLTSRMRERYSKDAGPFMLEPDMVVLPADVKDICQLVRYVQAKKSSNPALSLTPRGGGTGHNGGALGESLVIDTRRLQHILRLNSRSLQAEAGGGIGELQKRLRSHASTLVVPPHCASSATLGGLIAGSTAISDALSEVKVVLADGNIHTFRPVSGQELIQKKRQKNFEGHLYKGIYNLLTTQAGLLEQSRPQTIVNAAGYNLWDVWDPKKKVLNLAKLFAGSEGTLGIITEASLRVTRRPQYQQSLFCAIDIEDIDVVLRIAASVGATSITFSTDYTFRHIWSHMAQFSKAVGFRESLRLLARRLPSSQQTIFIRLSFSGATKAAVDHKKETLRKALFTENIFASSQLPPEAEMALENHTLPSIPLLGNFAIPPRYLSAFLPHCQLLLKSHGLHASVSGNLMDGTIHISNLPLARRQPSTAKLLAARKEMVSLVLRYKGTVAATASEGLLGGYWLRKMYGPAMCELFNNVKHLFDPDNLFNPQKKANADWHYAQTKLLL